VGDMGAVMGFRRPHPYAHKEAYCLMQYQDTANGEIEVLWNSRDGVTPFCITSRAGNEALHIQFAEDRCEPMHVPALGDRVFVDLSIQRAREMRTAYVEAWWDSLSDIFESKADAVEQLARGDVDSGTRPDIVVVDEAWLAEFRRGAS